MTLDPRKELEQDSLLWQAVLGCASAYKDKQIYGNLHGFRCSGARLILKENILTLQLSSEWDDATKKEMKQKYIVPCLAQIKTIFKFVAEHYNKQQDFFN